MKRLIALLLLSTALCAAEEITLPKSTVLRTEHSMMSLKAGTVVEVVSRDDKTLTVTYKNVTGTIPASALVAAPAAPAAAEAKKKEEPSAPPAEKGAQTTYGKAVQKAKENAGKHDKNVVKPADEVMQDK